MMNWVGGSRSRLLMKSDAKKQKEFFEKKKMQQRMKQLGVTLPTSSPCPAASGSLDLVTLFIVNQIAAKKTNKDPPKIAVHSSRKGGLRHNRREAPVLPMSPCSPSTLALVESPYSRQRNPRRKYLIPQRLKSPQLSPVLESTFSDNSASDYLPSKAEPHASFSSTSSSSQSQGLFPLRIELQKESQNQTQMLPHYSPPPWMETSEPQQTQLRPFSKSRDLTESVPWSRASEHPFLQLQTPTAAQVLFQSLEPKLTVVEDCHGPVETFSLNHPEQTETMMDLVQDSKEQFEDEVFKGFTNDEREGGDSLLRNEHMKVYQTDETPSTRAESDRQCTEQSLPGPEHSMESTDDCECPTSYLCERGYLSSDSDDEAESCLCLQEAEACVESSAGNQPRPYTPSVQSTTNLRDEAQDMDEEGLTETLCESQEEQIESSEAHFSASQKLELCKCRDLSRETNDAGTQTEHSRAADVCDASTQCSFAANCDITSGFINLPSAKLSQQPASSGRQDGAAREPNMTVTSAENSEREDSGFISNLQKSTKPVLEAARSNDHTEMTESDIGEGGHHGNMSGTPGARATKLSETETLQEIADILLLMNQWKKK